jgi:hypothetical protein
MANNKSNCRVLDSRLGSDRSWIKRVTPMDTKRKELADAEDLIAPDIDKKRESAVTRSRRGGNVRPLDGSGQ